MRLCASRNPEKTKRVLAHQLAKLIDRMPFDLGHALSRDRQIRRLVPLPPMRLGREERAVGLDHKPLYGNSLDHFGKVARVGVGDRTGDRDIKAEFQRSLGELNVAGKAVHDSTNFMGTLLTKNL